MDVEVLNHFLTVVREENISRAAELLHLTQPTLSRQMAALEEELAEKAGTISYELLCMIGRRVPRVYMKGGQPVHVTDYLL